jgi:anti-sigma regulatory factor (Ser/Thr protein kinase)
MTHSKDKQLVAELRFEARPEHLKMMRCVVREATVLCGSTSEVAEKIVIAVNEACMNIIQHAYNDDLTGEIILEIINNHPYLVFKLTDFAETIDASRVQPRALDEIRPGGLGTHFINELMDEVTFSVPESGKGNLLKMRIKL